jgi:hypothetical protein
MAGIHGLNFHIHCAFVARMAVQRLRFGAERDKPRGYTFTHTSIVVNAAAHVDIGTINDHDRVDAHKQRDA